MSKEVKPKQRIGQVSKHKTRKMILWGVVLAAASGGAVYAYRYAGKTVVEIPTARVRKGEFIISVKTRGEVKSTNSMILAAPQVPDPKITKLAESGKPINKGDVVIEFDAAQQEQYYIDRSTTVRTVDSEIVQMKASQRIVTEADAMNLMVAEYSVERAKLEASKAEVVSEIEGAKSRIDVGVTEGDLKQQGVVIGSHKVSQEADLERLQQKKDKTVRDQDRAKGYLSKMVIRAPIYLLS